MFPNAPFSDHKYYNAGSNNCKRRCLSAVDHPNTRDDAARVDLATVFRVQVLHMGAAD